MDYWGDWIKDGKYKLCISKRYQHQVRAYWTIQMVKQGSTVLDVGCGSGQIPMELAKMGCNVTGIDNSPAMIEDARKTAKSQNLDICFMLGRAEKLPFPDNSFDFVICNELLQYVKDKRQAIREMKRVAKYQVIISVLLMKSLFYPARIVKREKENTYVKHYTYRNFMDDISASGLEVTEEINSTIIFVPAALLFRPVRSLLFAMDKTLDRSKIFRGRSHHLVVRLERKKYDITEQTQESIKVRVG
jgi:ubiquinone/menaquinone biosynthesis C-methylase UbiE